MSPLLPIFYVAGLALLVGFVHPYVTYPLSLKLFPERPLERPPQAASSTGSEFSLLFCAYNEIDSVEAMLTSLRSIKDRCPDIEILAYDDNSSDGTLEALRAAPDVLRVVHGTGRTGKAHGMKILAGQAAGTYLMFTDANVSISPGAVDAFSAAYADPAVGAVCGKLNYRSSAGTSTESVGGFYWRLEERIKSQESRTGNVMGADGAIFSVRKALYPDFPDTVQDDFTVSMSAIFAGHRLVRCADAVAVEDLVTESREEFRRKVRIAARAYHTHLHLRPGLKGMSRADRYKYFSHKVLRWHGATLMLLGTAFATGALGVQFGLWALAAMLAGGGALVAVILLGLGLSGQVREVLLAITATNWGVWQALRGRTYATWKPPPR